MQAASFAQQVTALQQEVEQLHTAELENAEAAHQALLAQQAELNSQIAR